MEEPLENPDFTAKKPPEKRPVAVLNSYKIYKKYKKVLGKKDTFGFEGLARLIEKSHKLMNKKGIPVRTMAATLSSFCDLFAQPELMVYLNAHPDHITKSLAADPKEVIHGQKPLTAHKIYKKYKKVIHGKRFDFRGLTELIARSYRIIMKYDVDPAGMARTLLSFCLIFAKLSVLEFLRENPDFVVKSLSAMGQLAITALI